MEENARVETGGVAELVAQAHNVGYARRRAIGVGGEIRRNACHLRLGAKAQFQRQRINRYHAQSQTGGRRNPFKRTNAAFQQSQNIQTRARARNGEYHGNILQSKARISHHADSRGHPRHGKIVAAGKRREGVFADSQIAREHRARRPASGGKGGARNADANIVYRRRIPQRRDYIKVQRHLILRRGDAIRRQRDITVITKRRDINGGQRRQHIPLGNVARHNPRRHRHLQTRAVAVNGIDNVSVRCQITARNHQGAAAAQTPAERRSRDIKHHRLKAAEDETPQRPGSRGDGRLTHRHHRRQSQRAARDADINCLLRINARIRIVVRAAQNKGIPARACKLMRAHAQLPPRMITIADNRRPAALRH